MSKEHHLVIVPGLGDPTKPMEWITRNWDKTYGIIPHVHAFGWQGEKELFEKRLQRVDDFITELLEKEYTVSLLGASAGGSAVINIFSQRKSDIHRVISVCGRLHIGERVKPTLNKAAKDFPIFKESVLLCEKNLKKLSRQDKAKILTIRPLYDEVVPLSTQTIPGATNKQIISAEHMLSISLVMTMYVRSVIEFLKAT